MSKKTVYKGNVIEVVEQKIGSTTYESALVQPGIVIFPITDDGKILLIKEKRVHEVPDVRWKMAAGFYEKEYSWQENAQRELQEEVGKKATKLEILLDVQNTGTIDLRCVFVLARGLIDSKLPNPDGDVVLEIKPFTIDELFSASLSNNIPITLDSMGIFYLYSSVKSGNLILE